MNDLNSFTRAPVLKDLDNASRLSMQESCKSTGVLKVGVAILSIPDCVVIEIIAECDRVTERIGFERLPSS